MLCLFAVLYPLVANALTTDEEGVFLSSPDAVIAPNPERQFLEAPMPPKLAPKPQKVAQAQTAPATPPVSSQGRTVTAYVTGYNTVAGQTDSTPCIAAGGNICGRVDTVACPSWIPLHTWVEIRGKRYECMDRTHGRFNGRFDISCDKDMACPNRHTGTATVKVLQ